ncbi:MAG: diguanylate cyclase/phosphodiesterase (GGDEF & EAL domains) with PAS/PAC sensor(s) [uncultured Thiotrichaceae bacterium]|uniref:Diguanylate cyclase/phosphodiesterase (GGDEF & EAL domains) with PAS/PAC sensor(S) n=1 Tax=uncultured Thiotrichaceae bacterium TaxID=298394 RepID=A0A6S6TWD7_9GAMM|nr:MAG: diguanylate cyclase/phosphodiesterase (GGDEF & EAL domains) with PAS/PAC sensor(s) [uncultured Thiotrichaceae bacterium]
MSMWKKIQHFRDLYPVVLPWVKSSRKVTSDENKPKSLSSGLFQVKTNTPDSAEWILEALAGGVLTVNKQGKVLYINHSAQQMIGSTAKKAVGKPVGEILDLEDSQGNALAPKIMELHRSHPQHLLQFGRVKLNPHEGDSCFVELHTSFLQDKDKTLVFIFRDVQTDRRVINELYQQASHDALTGLMNRRSFEEYLEQAVNNEAGELRTHVLVSIDLDRFKTVNDSCGHQAGDELLKQASHIFQKAVRQSDKVARLGGDEFAIFLEGCEVEKARRIMDGVLVELKNHQFSWEERVFSISASIGLVEFLPSSALSVKTLFSDADKACYTAKALGRGQTFAHINADDSYHVEQRRTDWGKLLDLAMENDRFILFVQPIVDLQATNDTYQHYEVLLRLPFRKHLLSPGSFLPAADRLDMMGRIDRWIIRRVLMTAAENKFHDPQGIRTRFMINLSSQAVQDPDLFGFIEVQMKEFGTDPVLFCFEVSESVAIANFMQTKRLMMALDALGCHLALDNFGSGFSSLNYVRELPLAYLKIDGNFVHNLVTNAVDAAMIKAVHEVGQVMQLKTIAELVEDSETMSQLRTIGVDYAQGFHCGKPFPFLRLCESGIADSR